MNKLITKIAFKVLLGAVICILVAIALATTEPIITNDLAIGQLANDNYAFAAWETWNAFRSFLAGAEICIWFVIAALVCKDVYDYMKNKEKK